MLDAQDLISIGFNTYRVQIGRDRAELDDNRVNRSESVLLILMVKHLQGQRKSAALFLIMHRCIMGQHIMSAHLASCTSAQFPEDRSTSKPFQSL